MNLLNGLAVSDTGMIREKAEVVSAISRVETISYIESLLLGDPFDFLSNWPLISWIRCARFTTYNYDTKFKVGIFIQSYSSS